MKSDQLFEKFLVETGLSRQFLTNIRKAPLRSFLANRSGLDQLKNLDPMDYVSMAFSWKDAPEGIDYWYLVDVTWTDLFKGNFSFDDAKTRIKAIQNLVAGLSRYAKTRIKIIQNLAAELSR